MELGHVITEKEKKGRPKRAIAGSEKFVAGFLSGLMWTSPDLMWISSAMTPSPLTALITGFSPSYIANVNLVKQGVASYSTALKEAIDTHPIVGQLALVVSHASLPSEVYWQTVLPNSPMPAAINDLLQAGHGPASWLNMKLHLTKITNVANFLPREVADSIPFSSTKLPQILNRFSLRPKSVEAQIMKETNEQCEGPGNVGEDKYCATSLESLIDFSTLELGKKCSSTFN